MKLANSAIRAYIRGLVGIQKRYEAIMNLYSKLSLVSRSRVAAGTLFSVGLLAVTLTNPNVWLQSGFETAIAQSAFSQTIKREQTPWTPPIVGSESFWLGTPDSANAPSLVHPTSWQKPVAKGDRFAIVSGERQREFEVVKIEPFAQASADHVGPTALGSADQFVVICKSTDAEDVETLKFLLEPGAPLPWASEQRRKARTL